MRKSAWVAGVLALVMVSLSGWALENDATCRHDNSNFGDDLETYQTQEQFTVPMNSAVMQVTAAKNGGVRLVSGTGDHYEVTVCKYAGANSQAEGDEMLKQITAEHTANAIGIRGPEGHHWVASLIIQVPKGANMSVSAHNGPLSAKEISGTFHFETVNGPISVKRVEGKVTASAKNGPISFHGQDGDYDLETQNGPISIDLESQSWQNGKLDAHANNGPVSLHLPKGYQSGVVVTSDGHSPMHCDADICNDARKTWDDNERRIEFGSSSPVIRISTHNGPVSVEKTMADM